MSRTLFVILAVLAVAAGVYAVFARDLRAARARLAGRSKTVETSFGTLEYAVMGEGAPVLIVHGAEGGFDQGIDTTGALAGRGYRLIAPSRFGYLRSTLPGNPTAAMQADAYAQLLDRLGIDKVAVVGISAGAWSSLQFAIRHPERCRALVLLGPADYLPAGMSSTDVAMQSAGITLVRGDLRGIAKAIRLSRATMRNIRQNLFFAFLYNALGIPLAAGILYPFAGWLLSPIVAGAAMSLSSVSVIGNALRLRNIKL